MTISFTKNRLIALLAVIFLIGLWKAGSVLLDSELILPSPEKTAVSVGKLLIKKDFARIVGATILRGLAGFGISFVLALVLGIAAGINSRS